MRKLQPYQPTSVDLGWAANTLRLLKDKCRFSTRMEVYQIDKTAKTITLVFPEDPWANPLTLLHHHRHHCVWAKLGYTVHPVIDWDSLELPDKMPDEPQSK